MRDLISILGITIGGFIIGFSLAVFLLADDYVELRKQDIERGHAEYVVDSDGKTTWKWKE